MGKLYLATLKGIWLWGLLSWVYVAAIVLDPVTTHSQLQDLSFYVPIPTNLFGVLGFVVSFIAYVLWSWRKDV